MNLGMKLETDLRLLQAAQVEEDGEGQRGRGRGRERQIQGQLYFLSPICKWNTCRPSCCSGSVQRWHLERAKSARLNRELGEKRSWNNIYPGPKCNPVKELIDEKLCKLVYYWVWITLVNKLDQLYWVVTSQQQLQGESIEYNLTDWVCTWSEHWSSKWQRETFQVK